MDADRRGQVEQLVQVLNVLSHAHFKVNVVTKEQELQKP